MKRIKPKTAHRQAPRPARGGGLPSVALTARKKDLRRPGKRSSTSRVHRPARRAVLQECQAEIREEGPVKDPSGRMYNPRRADPPVMPLFSDLAAPSQTTQLQY